MPYTASSSSLRTLLSYSVSSGQFFNSTVDHIEITNVTQVWEVDGIVNISDITTQPVYVRLQNGTEQWVYLGQLNSTMKIFDPLNGTWMPVYSIVIRIGNWTVYEPDNAPFSRVGQILRGTYIANGILLDLQVKT
ncbi:MAG: hypothetical protein M1442_02490 [Candidatus Thermoplasmatota archaeon]|nr:hypothetical protein [Candidatus Thermoplasmatota archaeon]